MKYVSRRKFAVVLGTGSTVGLAGCSGTLTEDDDAGSGSNEASNETDDTGEAADAEGDPEVRRRADDELAAALEAYTAGFDDGDFDAILEVVHPDGPEWEILQGLGADTIEAHPADYEIEYRETYLQWREDDSAMVESVYTRNDEVVRKDVELRTEDGEWKVWDEEGT